MRKKVVERWRTITFTSDFGLEDAYVAEMKSAVLKYSPHALFIDVTHQIKPQNVLHASIILQRIISSFLPETVHLAVVDPGVGSDRQILIVQVNDQWVVCPDNGLITWAWRRNKLCKAWHLTWRPPKSSATFHGRDIMGPVAGMLAAGAKISQIAKPTRSIRLLDVEPSKDGGGNIIYIDHFGNAVSNILKESISLSLVRLGKRIIPIKRTYSDVPIGKPLALVDSNGLLEIAVRKGSASKRLHIRVGDKIVLTK